MLILRSQVQVLLLSIFLWSTQNHLYIYPVSFPPWGLLLDKFVWGRSRDRCWFLAQAWDLPNVKNPQSLNGSEIYFTHILDLEHIPQITSTVQFRRFTDSVHHQKPKNTRVDTMWTTCIALSLRCLFHLYQEKIWGLIREILRKSWYQEKSWKSRMPVRKTWIEIK